MDIKNTKKYPEKLYTNISIRDLIVVGIYFVLVKENSCTFERLVAECFTRFPKVFGFKRYPQWPDSLKFDRNLRTLRERGLVIGSSRGYLSLTKFGKQKALDIKKILEKNYKPTQKETKVLAGRSAEDRLITYLKNSRPFKSYLQNPTDFSISESEFVNLLRCTLETPLRILKQNLEYYKKISRDYDERQLLNFLLLCEKRFIKKGG